MGLQQARQLQLLMLLASEFVMARLPLATSLVVPLLTLTYGCQEARPQVLYQEFVLVSTIYR